MLSSKSTMGSTRTNLYYLKPSDLWCREKPYFITVPPSALPEGQKVTNEESTPVENIQIHDYRSHERTMDDLDSRGFAVAQQDFSWFCTDDFRDCRSLRVRYVPTMEAWLKQLLGAESVFTLSVNIRRRDVKFPEFTWGTTGDTQPIQGVHIGTLYLPFQIKVLLNAQITPQDML